VALSAVALIASACGDDDDDTDANATEAAAVEADPAVEEAASEEAPAEADAAGERPADWPETLTFGAVPSEQATQLEESYQLTIQILEAELGIDIEFFQAADYAGIVEAQIAGTVDAAQYGPFSYIIAENNGADIQPAGVITDGPDIEPGYRSYGITQAGNGEINGIADFAERNVCFVDPGSTSGYLYPSAGLLGEGIDPESGVQGTFAGGHDASALSVANGTCEAGFAFDSMVTNELIEAGDLRGVVDATGEGETVNEAEAEIKIVWKSPVIAGSPIAINNSLPESFVDAFVDTVSTKLNIDWAVENGYCASADDCQFTDEEGWGYVYRDATFFDGVRQVCEETQSPACVEA
jgi:phosphonate transport system substrate-binding protein